MAKHKYVCGNCKKALPSPLGLTKHIKACKSGRLPGKEGKVVCPDCGEKVKQKGIGSHRKAKHGVVGSSRWALRNRKNNGKPVVGSSIVLTKGRHVSTAYVAERGRPGGVKEALERYRTSPNLIQSDEDTLRDLVDHAVHHRKLAIEHARKAEQFEKMTEQLRAFLNDLKG